MDSHSEYAPIMFSQCVEVLLSTGADNVGGPARINAAGYVQRAVGAAFQSRFSTGGRAFTCQSMKVKWIQSTMGVG